MAAIVDGRKVIGSISGVRMGWRRSWWWRKWLCRVSIGSRLAVSAFVLVGWLFDGGGRIWDNVSTMMQLLVDSMRDDIS